jgi:hypothetical protein
LEVEVLEIVARPFALQFFCEYLVVPIALPPAVDLGQVLEEEPGAPQKAGERAIVISREGVDASLDIGEVLAEESGHVLKQATTIGQGRLGARGRTGAVSILLAGCLGYAVHDGAMADIPGDPRQLGGSIGSPHCKAGSRLRHALHPLAVDLS